MCCLATEWRVSASLLTLAAEKQQLAHGYCEKTSFANLLGINKRFVYNANCDIAIPRGNMLFFFTLKYLAQEKLGLWSQNNYEVRLIAELKTILKNCLVQLAFTTSIFVI